MFERPKDLLDIHAAYPDPHPEAVAREAIELEINRELEKWSNRRRRLMLMMSGAAIASTAIVTSYGTDVAINQAKQANAQVSFEVVAPALNPANSNQAIIFIDGYYTENAKPLAENLGKAVQQVTDGTVVELDLNNAVLDRGHIDEKAEDLIEEHHFTGVTLVGRSEGGIMSTELAADLVANSSTPVKLSILIDTPDGMDGLNPSQKENLDIVQTLAESIPSAADSTPIRLILEVYAHKDNFTQEKYDSSLGLTANIVSFIKNSFQFIRTVSDAVKQLNGPDVPSSQLIVEQGSKIAQFNMSQELNTMADHKDDKEMPDTLYIGDDDKSIVDAMKSSENFEGYAEQVGLNYTTYLVPGATHQEYDRSLDEYMRVFSEASGPIAINLQAEAKRHALILAAKDAIEKQEDNSTLAQK